MQVCSRSMFLRLIYGANVEDDIPTHSVFPSFSGLPNPSLHKNEIRIVAPRYTNPTLPQTIAFHCQNFQKMSPPKGAIVSRCPKSAINNPARSVRQIVSE